MFDDLRESANDSDNFDTTESDLSDFNNFEPKFGEDDAATLVEAPRPSRQRRKARSLKGPGLSAGQRFILAVLFFFLVSVFSVLCLLVTGTVII